jgi:glycosyltransferase involved in cell wall biosynthesis
MARPLALVSIVTPVLNAARFLPALLASVRGQDHPHIEHIVVDGGSTDGSVEIARGAPGVTLVTGRDAGLYDAINRGFERARGELLGYQNADDRYADPVAVRSMVEHFDAHPEADVVYGDYRLIDVTGRPTAEVRAPEFTAARLYRYNFVPPHSTLVRRRVVIDDGLRPDPQLRFSGDWDWFVRMARAGKRFSHLPRVVSEFREHDRSVTATVGWRLKIAEWRRTCKHNGISFPSLLWNEAVYRPLRRRLTGARRRL